MLAILPFVSQLQRRKRRKRAASNSPARLQGRIQPTEGQNQRGSKGESALRRILTQFRLEYESNLLFMNRVLLLGVPIDPLTRIDAIVRIKNLLGAERQSHVMTPNNEMLVEATKNPAFRSVLQKSHLNLPDSMGLLFAARWTHQTLQERVPGVDTVEALLKTISSEHPVYFLGAAEGVAQQAASALQVKNPHLKIAGTFSGHPNDSTLIERINAAKPHLLLVAFGAPKQDMWIDQHLKNLPTVRVAMGVGGTFDFLAGKIKRAPAFMRSLGLEWLWRLLQEPRRIGRIWRAVIVFPVLILRFGSKAR